jgi:hypothetical protein
MEGEEGRNWFVFSPIRTFGLRVVLAVLGVQHFRVLRVVLLIRLVQEGRVVLVLRLGLVHPVGHPLRAVPVVPAVRVVRPGRLGISGSWCPAVGMEVRAVRVSQAVLAARVLLDFQPVLGAQVVRVYRVRTGK